MKFRAVGESACYMLCLCVFVVAGCTGHPREITRGMWVKCVTSGGANVRVWIMFNSGGYVVAEYISFDDDPVARYEAYFMNNKQIGGAWDDDDDGILDHKSDIDGNTYLLPDNPPCQEVKELDDMTQRDAYLPRSSNSNVWLLNLVGFSLNAAVLCVMMRRRAIANGAVLPQ